MTKLGRYMEVSLTSVIAVGACGAILGVSLWALAAARRVRKNVLGDPGAAARRRAQRLLDRAQDEGRARADEYLERGQTEMDQRRMEVAASEDRLAQREQTLEQRASNLALREQMAARREAEADDLRSEAERLGQDARARLERVSLLDADAAKEELLKEIREETRRESMLMVRETELRVREEADRRARRILVTALERMAAPVTAETTVSAVSLPNDELKGRIIGREGRNIRAFESVTGVNLVVDDTPETVMVSSFDPIRREVARLALEKLVANGRIYPASIEEFYEKAQTEVEQSVRDAGEWAVLEVGTSQMHPELITLLGRLKYRTSYGQNVLNHLIETAHLAGMLAAEFGIDPADVKRSAFLHDIGKAVTHEVQGSHALIGAEIARRFGEDPAVVHGIEAHHNEVEPRTLLSIIVQAADTVSASRPGARNNTAQSYMRRLEKIESLVREFSGVDQVYAMQAGREVRIVVDPGQVDDLAAAHLARSVARRMETDLRYSNHIQVTVIREVRITDYAR